MSTVFWMALGNLALALPLSLLAWLVGRRWRRPALAHGLWVLVLLKLVTPPVGQIPLGRIPWEASPEPVAMAVVEAAPSENAANQARETGVIPSLTPAPEVEWLEVATAIEEFLPMPERVKALAEPAPVPFASEPLPERMSAAETLTWMVQGLATLWIAGAVWFFVASARRMLRFRRLLTRSLPVSAELRRQAETLARELGVSCPRLVAMPGLISPALWVGLRHAYLVVPRDLFDRLGPEQQVALLLHELAHWRRGDHWVRRLEVLALALYWWCPLVWWARLELQQAEEECCDAWVVSTAPESARAYALAILETVDFLGGARPALPPLASGLGPFRSMQRRLTMIFRVGTPRSLTAVGVLGLGALALVLLPWSPAPAPQAAAQGEGPERPGKKEFRDKEFKDKDFRDKERDKERDKDRKPDFKRGPDNLDRLREEAKHRQAELEQMQRELGEKMRDLAAMMEKLRQAEGGRAGEGPGPGPGRLFKPKFEIEVKPGFGTRVGFGGGAGGDLDRRIGEVERKLDVLIWELGNLRREMGTRGPGGPPPGGPDRPGFQPPPGGRGGVPGRRPDVPEGRDRKGGEERGPAPVPVPERRKGPDGPRD